MNWTQISKEMPPECTPVFLTDGKMLTVGEYDPKADPGWVWTCVGSYDGAIDDLVIAEGWTTPTKWTHWMPLMELPK